METRLFTPGSVPEHTTEAWYAQRERAPHLEEWVHQARMRTAARMVQQASERHGVRTISDMGCGDGGMLTLLPPGVRAWGYDLQPANVSAAINERHVDARLGNATGDTVEWGDLAICTEVLEHLVDPHGFLARIPSRIVVASSPATETVQSHYAFHTWVWDQAGYAAMFTAAGLHVEQHEPVGMFQVLLAVRP